VVKHIYCLIIMLLLVGCKSAPQPSATNNTRESDAKLQAPVEPAPIATRPDARPVIICFGDSLTEGYGAEAGKSYPDFLQSQLDRSGFHYRVVNAGVSGNTTKDAVERIEEVTSLHPAVVIVAFGGNDGLRGLPLTQTEANLEQIVFALRKSGAKIVLGGITLPPNYGADYIRGFNAIFTRLAKKYRLPNTPFLLNKVWNMPGGMQADGIHATAKGNEQVASNLLPLVTPLLKR